MSLQNVVRIESILSANNAAHEAWVSWKIAEGRPVGARPFPTMWGKFLASDVGKPFAHLFDGSYPDAENTDTKHAIIPVHDETDTSGDTDVVPVRESIREPVRDREIDTEDAVPQDIVPVSDAGTRPVVSTGSDRDLLDLIARGIQGRVQGGIDTTLIRNVVEDVLREKGDISTGASAPRTIRIERVGRAPREIPDAVPYWFDRAMMLATCGINVLLIGPAGCGKTHGVGLIAKALDLPFTAISLSQGVDEGSLNGYLLPIGDAGRFEFADSPFTAAIQQPGVILLDELDAAHPNAMLTLNAILANGYMTIPQRLGAPRVDKHPECIIVAAANTFGHGADRKFVAREQMDEATLSRFRQGQIACDYDSALEKALYPQAVVRVGHMLRKRCRAQKGWTRDVSTRDLDGASLKFPVLGTAENTFYEYFCDWKADELARINVTLDRNNYTVDIA